MGLFPGQRLATPMRMTREQPYCRSLRSLAGAARRYLFRVAPLPHATCSLSTVLGAGIAQASLDLLAEGAVLGALALALPASGWFGLALLCLADGYCRNREYLRLKSIMARRGFHPRLLQPVATSRCQRDAALAAAQELGYLAQTRAHFRALGYRWWHLLPDGTAANPLRFFTPAFLRVTFVPSNK